MPVVVVMLTLRMILEMRHLLLRNRYRKYSRPNKSPLHTSTAVKSVGGFFRRTLLENDTSAVTVARIDVFPNDDDVEEEERDDETTTPCKKYTPALTTYLKGTERLDGEDLALHHARESVRRFGLGRRTVASVIDFTKKTSDDDSSSSSAAVSEKSPRTRI